jgi:hypothetical protein
MRKNPVHADLKGFDGRARIYNVSCGDKGAWGLPSRISFEFCSWFKNKDGTEARGTIEPPEWSIIVNKMVPTGYMFSSDLFDRESGFFTVPLDKETLDSGIDVYDGECYVVYDSERPPYWLPVSVNEAFAVVRANWKNHQDKITAEEMLKWIEKEYAEIPVPDRDKSAYFGGNLSRISSSPGFTGAENIFPRIMKTNPEYWDRQRPKSSIQFIYFRMIGNRAFLKNRTTEALQGNSTSYHLYRFEESLDINTARALQPLVGE